ncbi:MAG: hydantoinase/oxoprolinase family protein [Pseudomonadales bacterium]|nr:hydantoinase/oxoprolinase family protein [Pseudomonadales bacterium]
MNRLAVDIGGTFTDVVLETGSDRTTVKVLTTHGDPAEGVMHGVSQVLAEARVAAADIEVVIHGTTLATNALIERRGARTALITTKGHRDALAIGLENRFEQYDLGMQRPPPLVGRKLRLTVDERVSAAGEVLLALDESSVLDAVATLRAAGVDSVAIGLLHAYVNPRHEQRVAALLAEHLPDLSLSLSSEVCPEIREYERLSTTCANAYVRPLMDRYLSNLEHRLRAAGLRCSVLVMTSGGGLATLETARRFPIRLVESGPAGGALLAAALARRSGWSRALAFDMGGTTAKLTLLDDGRPQWSRAFEVARAYRFRKGSGLPVRIPVIEMVEIGAGGGSVARVDRLGRLQTGPDSAGSEPGPAAYGRGGEMATVTDADLVLGKLSVDGFAGGTLELHADKAVDAVERHVARPLGVTVTRAAMGISDTVEEAMAAAARSHAGEWGRELDSRTLIAFGGAAPLHAAGLARRLNITRVVVPHAAGVGSAVGFLLAPVAFEVVRSRHAFVDELDVAATAMLLTDMQREAFAVVAPLVPADRTVVTRRAYMRYVGQGYEIAVALPEGVPLDNDLLTSRFETAYNDLYGRVIPGQRIEILSWTLAVAGPAPAMNVPPVSARADGDAGQSAWFDGEQMRTIPVLQRTALRPGERRTGPVLVTEAQTTTLVPPGWMVEVDDLVQLVLTRVKDEP